MMVAWASMVRVEVEREWTGPADGLSVREREVFQVLLLSSGVRVLPIPDVRRTCSRNWLEWKQSSIWT